MSRFFSLVRAGEVNGGILAKGIDPMKRVCQRTHLGRSDLMIIAFARAVAVGSVLIVVAGRPLLFRRGLEDGPVGRVDPSRFESRQSSRRSTSGRLDRN